MTEKEKEITFMKTIRIVGDGSRTITIPVDIVKELGLSGGDIRTFSIKLNPTK